MKKLFSLGINILNRFKYPQKFILIFLLFMIPLSVLIYLNVNTITEEIDHSKNEQAGITHIASVRTFIQHLQQHRGLSSAYLGGQNEMKEQMLAKQAEIAQDIQAIDSLQQQNAHILHTSDNWQAIKDTWNALVAEVATLPLTEAMSRQTDLIAKVIEFSGVIADQTGLLTEADPENNHLVQTVVFKLPWATEYMGQSRAAGSAILAKRSMTKDEESNLIYLKRAIEKELRDAEQSMNRALSGNEHLKMELEQLNTAAFAASNSLIQTINEKILNTSNITYPADEYYSFATNTVNSVYELLNAESNVLYDLLDDRIQQLIKERIQLNLLVLLIIVLVSYIFAAFYLAVKETISIIQNATGKIAQGNLVDKVQLKTKDETALIGESMNTMIDSFRGIISENKEIANEVASSSQQLAAVTEQTTQATNQIATSMQSVANGAEQQLMITEETKRSVGNMNSSVQRIAEKSSTVANESQAMATEAERGNESIQQTVQQMISINQSVQQTSSLITSLGTRSDEIGKILEVISSIASQTNLLALNAAIEAARAGEHGRGFSVVAEEVRKLAEQSEQSAQQIAALIRDIQQDTKRSVESMMKVTSDVSNGTAIVHESGAAFQRIVNAAQLVAKEIHTVSTISEQISTNSQQVLESVNQMSYIAKEAAANAQQVAASTEEQLASMEEVSATVFMLNSKAQQLQEMIDRYQV